MRFDCNHYILIGDVRIVTKWNLFHAEIDGHETTNADELFMDLNFLNNYKLKDCKKKLK